MQRNVNALVYDPRTGKALLDPGEAGAKDMTVASAITNALLSVNAAENPQPSATEKGKRYALAEKVIAGQTSLSPLVDFSDEELARIKTVADLYGTMVYGAITIWADTDIPSNTAESA